MNDITPKEAIANLNHLYGMVSPDIQRSLDVAIKALERPTGDLISREELKKAIWSLVINENDDIPVLNAIETIDNAMSMHYTFLPQYQADLQGAYDCGYEKGKQDRPQGEWIIVKDEKWGDNVKCPFCGKELAGTDLNFCCKCGADMRKGGVE